MDSVDNNYVAYPQNRFQWFYDAEDSCIAQATTCAPPVTLPTPEPCPSFPPSDELLSAAMPPRECPTTHTCKSSCECPPAVTGYPTQLPSQYCTEYANAECPGMNPSHARWQARFRKCIHNANGVAGYSQNNMESEEDPAGAGVPEPQLISDETQGTDWWRLLKYMAVAVVIALAAYLIYRFCKSRRMGVIADTGDDWGPIMEQLNRELGGTA